MLKFIIASMVLSSGLLTSGPVHAASDVLAEKVITGGYVKRPPHGIRILRNGFVESFSGDQSHVLGVLYVTSRDEMSSLVEKSESQLEDLYPQAPHCVDDYDTAYTSYRLNGDAVVVAKKQFCHTFVSQNLVQIKNILDGFSILDKTPFTPAP